MIRTSLIVLTILAAVSLAACTIGPNTSYVAPLQQSEDAQVLADGMVEFIAMRLSAVSTTLILDPTPTDQAGNAMTPAFAAALRSHGFAVAAAGQAFGTNAHRIRYLVTPLDNGDLVRVTIDSIAQGSRFFVRNTAGGLQAGGPYTVTQVEAMQ
jgi:hypothetical protein